MTLTRRRLWNASAMAVAIVVIALVIWLYDLALRDQAFLTGWLLIGATLILALYNGRKKLPFVPLVASASWLQAHLYLGVTAAMVFFVHTGVRLPNGAFETVLWLAFVIMIVSGGFGIVATRVVPHLLNARGERVIFERIAIFRAQLAEEVATLAEASIAEAQIDTIAQYYTTRLRPFMARPRNITTHLLGARRPRQVLAREMGALHRHLGTRGTEALEAIATAVLAKDDLDFHYAWQGLLKAWLFVHIPATYVLLIAMVVHVTLVYAFSAGTL